MNKLVFEMTLSKDCLEPIKRYSYSVEEDGKLTAGGIITERGLIDWFTHKIKQLEVSQ